MYFILLALTDARQCIPGCILNFGIHGFGSCAVRDGVAYFLAGTWSQSELQWLHISILEMFITYMSLATYVHLFSEVSHVLEFTDNTGAEWTARKESPHAPLLQLIAERRASLLKERVVFTRTERVTTDQNLWADWLSRGRIQQFLDDVAAQGLSACDLTPFIRERDSAWLIQAAGGP